jgi:hypothetical protein
LRRLHFTFCLGDETLREDGCLPMQPMPTPNKPFDRGNYQESRLAPSRTGTGEASRKELEEVRGKTGRRIPQNGGGDGPFQIQTRLYGVERPIVAGKRVIFLVISFFLRFVVEHKFRISFYAWRHLEVYSE